LKHYKNFLVHETKHQALRRRSPKNSFGTRLDSLFWSIDAVANIDPMQRILKLIAILPPEPLFSEIKREQEFLSLKWGPKHALRTPPHITLIPPISLDSGEAGWLYGMAEALSGMFSPFNISLRNYESFRPRVIFINLMHSPELKDLQETWLHAVKSKMPHVLEKYPDRPFHPHVTLAHKDVVRGQFEKIWKYYSTKKFQATFPVDEFCMLEYSEEGWALEKRYPLVGT
jgi:2'-5' RNA ligase